MGDEPAPGMLNLAAVLALADPGSVAEARRIGATLGGHDAINIQFTSGTTGRPRGPR